MRTFAEDTKIIPESQVEPTEFGWDIVRVTSDSNPSKTYRVDVTFGRCSCPAWLYQRGGQRNPCKHLIRLGFKKRTDEVEVKEPSKAAKNKIPAMVYEEDEL